MNNRIRLLFVDHTGAVGGSQLVLVEHLRAIDPTRFDVHVACTDAVPFLLDRFRDAGATVHLVDLPRLRGLRPDHLVRAARSVRQLRRLIRDLGIQIVISNTTRASYMASVAVMGTPARLIWWIRDFFYPRGLYRLTRGIPAHVIYVAHALQRYYRDHDESSSVWPVASSLHARLSAVKNTDIEEARHRYGLTRDDIVVGYMGRLVREKGPEDLIEAIRILAPRYPALRLLVVGTGKDQANDVEPLLHALVERDELGSVVRFAGFQTNEALHYLLFDIFVITTRDFEAYPTSVVQALMAKRAVVASAVGGTPELIRDGQTGLLFTPGKVEELVARLSALLQDDSLRGRLAAAGHDQVMRENLESALADRAMSLYTRLAGRP